VAGELLFSNFAIFATLLAGGWVFFGFHP